MKALTDVMLAEDGTRAERIAARSKLYECVTAKVFRYIDNAKWNAEIETGRR